jgi:hypothetical protein
VEARERHWLRSNRHRIKIGQLEDARPTFDFGEDFDLFDTLDDFLNEECVGFGEHLYLPHWDNPTARELNTPENEADPWISPDLRTLVFVRGSDTDRTSTSRRASSSQARAGRHPDVDKIDAPRLIFAIARLFHLDDARSDCISDEARNAMNPEPFHQLRAVGLDGLDAQVEVLRDLFGRSALGDQLQDLALAR